MVGTDKIRLEIKSGGEIPPARKNIAATPKKI